jgi:hypothetical protein
VAGAGITWLIEIRQGGPRRPLCLSDRAGASALSSQKRAFVERLVFWTQTLVLSATTTAKSAVRTKAVLGLPTNEKTPPLARRGFSHNQSTGYFGSSTPLTTWITPLDCITSAVVTS